MKLASASFNNLLRREIDVPLKVLDILGYQPSLSSFEECLEEALGQRPEIKVAALNDDQAREEVKIVRSGYFPVINLTANYDRLPEKPSLRGDLRNESCNVHTLATFSISFRKHDTQVNTQ